MGFIDGNLSTAETIYSVSDDLKYVDVPKCIARDKAIQYCGRGIEFKHKIDKNHEKIWHEEINKDDAFYSILFSAVELASPYMTQAVEQSFATTDCAVLIESWKVDNTYYLVKSCYDKEKVIRTVWNSVKELPKINLAEFNAKLPEDKRIELGNWDSKLGAWVQYHNYGFVPVIAFANRPFFQFLPQIGVGTYFQSPWETTWNASTYNWNYASLKDSALCSGLIYTLQVAYTQLAKSFAIDKPRIIGSGINSTTENRYVGNKGNNFLSSDLFLQVGDVADLKTMPMLNSFQNYVDATEALWVKIYKTCGLSYVTQTGTNKTTTENHTQFRESIETIDFLRNWFTSQLTRIIIYMFKVAGIDLGKKEDWSFQVKKNQAIDRASWLDSEIKKCQINASNPIKIISEDEGIDYDYAEHIYQENEKINTEFAKKQAQITGAFMVSGVKGASAPTSKEKGGRPTDVEKPTKE